MAHDHDLPPRDGYAPWSGTRVPSAWVGEKLKLENIPQRTSEWFEARKGRLTASDAAAALGQNRYCSPDDLLARKANPNSGPLPPRAQEACDWGTKWEPHAARVYERITGNRVWECGLFVHPEHDFLAASPDGLVDSGPGPGGMKLLIEIKAPYRRRVIDSNVPPQYMPQLMLQMECLNADAVDFVQYVPECISGPEQVMITRIVRDREWFLKYLPVMSEFCARMRRVMIYGLPPPIAVPSAAKKRRARTRPTKPPPAPACRIIDLPADAGPAPIEIDSAPGGYVFV